MGMLKSLFLSPMKKIFLILFVCCIHHIQAQSSRPAVRQQFVAIDTVKNDSTAMAKLEHLVNSGNLTTVELLRANARIILRANALQQFAKSVKLANEGIAMARSNGLD